MLKGEPLRLTGRLQAMVLPRSRVSPHTVRFGVAENLYGSQAIAAYPRLCEPVGASRRLHHTVITTFGEDCATVSTEFNDGVTARVGRQMQTWLCLDGEWKVVAAHVSIDLSSLDARDNR